MARSILFVCLGNICRSPTAEAVLRKLTPTWRIDSAGTASWHVGKPPYGPMERAALARGLDMSDLRARQITPADFGRFDLIVGMDAENVQNIERLRPTGDTTRVLRLLDMTDRPGDVPDPYFTRDFEEALDLIEKGCAALYASQPQ